MPFFQQPAYLTPEATLFHFLNSLDDESAAKSCCAPAQQQQQQQQPQKKPEPTFTPRFDITETTQTYEIWGELPGLEQKDVSIEFTDAQTIVVKGKTERVPSTPAAAPTTTTAEVAQDTSSEKSFNPTVEDDYDAADAPLAATTPASPKSTSTVTTGEEKQQQQTEKPKFWIAERKVGVFERTFNFSKPIDLEAVTAGLKNGLLHVVIPKSQKTRKVVVAGY